MKNSNLIVAHKSSGTIQTREEKKLYKILLKLPSPKKEFNLTKSQKKWWYWFGNEFIKTRQVSLLDLTHLQKAAFWMDARCLAFQEISDLGYKGLVQKFTSGATNITGHVSIIEKADKHLEDVSSHFGLSLKDRQKLKVETTDASQLSLFENLVKKLAE